MSITINTTTIAHQPAITTAQLLSALNWRYATKKFDPAKKIPADTWAALENALVLSPSSLGIQPWKFIIVTDPALRQKLSAAAYGQPQVTDASHLVVFALRKNLDAAFVDKNIARMSAIRGVSPDSLATFRQMSIGAIERYAQAAHGTTDPFAAQQCHIALGVFVTAAALLGVDTCTMGGIDRDQFDDLLNLKNTGYAALVTCAAGYRSPDDKYATLAKVRFAPADVLARI